MADLSKIKLNGSTYNFKDGWARDNLQTASQVNTAINNALGNISGFSIEIVESLPTTGEQGIFYFVSNSGSGNNIYDEYVYVNDAFEKIGTTEVNLSNYLQKTEIADWAKASTKPSYTAAEVGALPDTTVIPTIPTNVSSFTNDAGYLTSFTETDPTVPSWAKASTKPSYTYTEVGAAASSHAHGSITNAGAITNNTALANGDRLVFSDSSDSNLLKRASITFGTSTTQYLANNGTWQNAYDDSALAARVQALEELEWATYYSGRSNPSNSQGKNGDIYLQY